MLKKSIAVLGGTLVLAVASATAFADTTATVASGTAVARANQAVQTAKQVEQTEQATYQALLQRAESVLSGFANSGSSASSYSLKQGIPALQSDLTALAAATTVGQAKTVLNQLEIDVEKLKESLNHPANQGSGIKERLNSLKSAVTASGPSTKKFVANVAARISGIQSEITSLPATATKGQVKQLVKNTEKLGEAVSTLEHKFAKWDGKINYELNRLPSSPQSGGSATPPSPPSAPSANHGSGGNSSGSTNAQPPAPPSAP